MSFLSASYSLRCMGGNNFVTGCRGYSMRMCVVSGVACGGLGCTMLMSCSGCSTWIARGTAATSALFTGFFETLVFLLPRGLSLVSVFVACLLIQNPF